MTPEKSAELELAAIIIATRRFFEKSYLDNLSFRHLLRLSGNYEKWKDSKEFESISALHCTDWAEMGTDIEMLVKETCLEMLDIVDRRLLIRKPDTVPAAKPVENTGFFGWLR